MELMMEICHRVIFIKMKHDQKNSYPEQRIIRKII